MNPFESLATLPLQLRHDAVRDLAWALTSPPLLAHSAWPQRHPLHASEWAQAPQRLAAWLHTLDAEPSALLAFLAQRSVRRLGLYYERLWQFAVAAAPGVELLAANLPVRDGARTLGEFDMLLRDAVGTHHVELAVKFYLGPPNGHGRSTSEWLGPGCHDRLDRKLAHLGEQQLRLAQQPAATTVLAAIGACQPVASLWLGGYLFYPWPRGGLAALGAHPAHLRGTWLHRRHWRAFADSVPHARFSPLPRARWLAPAASLQGLDGEQLEHWLQGQEPLMQAQMVVRVNAEGDEQARLFVVPDPWPALPRKY
ncbi:DUF1853 family protein [Pseudomonas typographi]|uniref:DUF1853 family protein n=1 Tax=Pseudomonas typographi TaxID=2715964 RepID=UPI0016837093|nr:DUF1853 family protein [Pseudomonas typographi]MBD1587423.1 DUF1853 family protein [Pseudomonas typographi]